MTHHSCERPLPLLIPDHHQHIERAWICSSGRDAHLFRDEICGSLVVFVAKAPAARIESSGQPPRGVGHLNISAGKLTESLSMASDALDPVMRLLLAGRLNFLDLYGEPMRYRHLAPAARVPFQADDARRQLVLDQFSLGMLLRRS